MEGHTRPVNNVSFSSDGTLIASGSDDKTIKLWDQAGNLITTLSGHADMVNSVAFSKDDRFLISGGSDNQIIKWKIDDLSLGGLIDHGCSWLNDYLETHPEVQQEVCN